ncbi:MAG TPA: EamA family transporter [bacterium]|nr:EamA family transporter [bacterium]
MPARRTPPTSKKSLSWDVWLALGLVYVVWGSTYLAIRFAIRTLPPFGMAGARFLVSGGLLFLFMSLRGVPTPPLRQWRSAGIVGFLLITVANGGVCWLERWVPSGMTALLVGTVPLWIAFLLVLGPKGTQPSVATWSGLFLGFLGIVLLVSGRHHGSFEVDPWGALGLVGTSLAWAIGSLYARKADLPASPLMGTSLEMILGGAGQIVVSLLLGEFGGFHLSGISQVSWEAWIYLTFIGSLVGFTSYIWVLQKATPELASTYAFVNPVIAVFLGWSLGGETLTGGLFLAAGCIVAAVTLVVWGSRKGP